MIAPTTANLTAQEKAHVIYEQARSDMSSRLWRAALGVEESTAQTNSGADKRPPISLDQLLGLLGSRAEAATAPQATIANAAPLLVDRDGYSGRNPRDHQGALADQSASIAPADRDTAFAKGTAYGPNAGYAPMLHAAARRTGLPQTALATILHAEAAKGQDGRWLPYSRNPRSSAAGLGQFLSSTWRGEAERKGTWLNMVAEKQGWLGEHGKVKASARGALLALRYDPQAAIQATADYAAANLDGLRKAGVAIGPGSQDIARAAYLGHHLGRGDAIRFLTGGLSPDRARILLNAQVGTAAASTRIAAATNAASAHRSWLLDYIGKNIQTARFDA